MQFCHNGKLGGQQNPKGIKIELLMYNRKSSCSPCNVM